MKRACSIVESAEMSCARRAEPPRRARMRHDCIFPPPPLRPPRRSAGRLRLGAPQRKANATCRRLPAAHTTVTTRSPPHPSAQ
eukprot:4864583-Pyramimonas_sp.AAC.1